jgi:hypothetical protein
MAWNLLQAGRLPGTPETVEVSQAGDGRHERIRASRKHDVIGSVAHASNLNDTSTGQASDATQQIDAPVS